MKALATYYFIYDIPDNPEDRERAYGTRVPEECAQTDESTINNNEGDIRGLLDVSDGQLNHLSVIILPLGGT